MEKNEGENPHSAVEETPKGRRINMSIFKRKSANGKFVYWYNFWHDSKHVQESAKTTNPRKARQAEAIHRAKLANNETGFRERKTITLSDFLKTDFLPFVESKFKASKPRTLRYYAYGAKTLRESDFATLNLEDLTDQHAGLYAAKRVHLSPSTVNCGLRTLRRALSLAYQWSKLDRMPKITLAKGERQRERVLTTKEANSYIQACSQPWRDAATIMLGTAMRPSEVFALRWEHILLNEKGGLLQITDGKSRAARRLLPLVPAVYAALKSRQKAQGGPLSGWVFSADTKSGHLEGGSAKNQHARALKTINTAAKKDGTPELKPFPPYCLRHTALSNLAVAGVDPFTLAKIAGHSSITITQRYCHPQADAIERAFTMLSDAKTPRELASADVRRKKTM
jgi:integrase